MNLQDRYWKWHADGMELSYLLGEECEELLTSVITVFRNATDPEVRFERRVKFADGDTFVSAWLDDQGRPCCYAKIDGAEEMAWRVESLDLEHKRVLHQLLTATLAELTADEGDA